MLNILAQRAAKYSLRYVLRLIKHYPKYTELSELYFAYGANTASVTLQKNDIHFHMLGKAVTNGQEIRFNVPCEYKHQGYAGISPNPQSSTWGTLYRVSKISILLLDILEWVPFSFYERVKIPVQLNGQESLDAWVYKPSRPKEALVPSTKYLKFIIKNSIENGFPQEYIDNLKNFESRERFELDHTFSLSHPALKRPFLGQLKLFYKLHDQIREKLSKWIP